jgi:DNA polymerase III epsilon subunit-like protein
MNEYVMYVCDTETNGLDNIKHSIIELSLYRLSDDIQKTWSIKPFNPENTDPAALRINGHKIEDLRGDTKYGQDTYLDPNQVIIDVENWMAEDNVPAAQRVLVGANTGFDKAMLDQLWIKCNSPDSFPFGRRYLDIQQIEFFLNMCQNNMLDSYSLSSIIKKYGIANVKAHTAAADTVAAKQVLDKQISYFKSKIGIE